MNFFLPVVLLLYFLVPFKIKNAVLLAASLFFYFWGEPVYWVVMCSSALIGYVFGLIIHKTRGTKWAKISMIASVVSCLAPLLFFKYSDFFISNINGIFKTGISPLNLVLPIGISFYTFQILSYTIDVYRDDARVQKNPISFVA